MSIIPKRVEIPEVLRTADAAYVLRTWYVQQQIAELEEGKQEQLPKLWRDHVQSVADFRLHLLRNGGVYTSPMETIRRVWRLPTIESQHK